MFPKRFLDYLEVDHSAAENRRAHELLTEIRGVAGSRRGRGTPGGRGLRVSLLKKRLFSSPKAFAETVETHLATMTAKDDAFAKEAGSCTRRATGTARSGRSLDPQAAHRQPGGDRRRRRGVRPERAAEAASRPRGG